MSIIDSRLYNLLSLYEQLHVFYFLLILKLLNRSVCCHLYAHGFVYLHVIFSFGLKVLFFCLAGVGSLKRTPSQRSAMIYQRNNYAFTAATYADPYRSAQYRPSDPNYIRQPVVMDDGATRSPSIDSIQKDPR